MQQPAKSSNEILSELFGAFNAEPPTVDLTKTSVTDKKVKHKKEKKSKKKKHKKQKKRKRTLSNSSTSNPELSKKKSNKRKRSKSVESVKSNSSELLRELKNKVKQKKIKEEKEDLKSLSSGVEVSLTKCPNISQSSVNKDVLINSNVKIESDSSPIKEEPTKILDVKEDNCNSESVLDKKEDINEKEKNEEVEVKPKIGVANAFLEDCLESGVKPKNPVTIIEKGKQGFGSKIMIKDLKNSTVFEETVRQVEEKARLKAERYEEGEISDSSNSHSRPSSPGSTKEGNDKTSLKSKAATNENECSKRDHRKRDKRRSKSKERHHHSCKTSHRSKMSSVKHKKSSRSRSRSRLRNQRKRSGYRSSKSDGKKSSQSKERRKSNSPKSSHHRHSRRSRSNSRSHSKDRRPSQEKIDKHKLLEIARKNALSMLKQTTPAGAVEPAKVTIAAGGKTVDELTDFCKLLSKKDAEGHESISSNTSETSDSESEKPFHHPFQIKDRPSSIVLNIKNSVSVPVKTLQEKTAEQSKALRLQFPVSSGQLHRKKESDWVPVSPKKETPPPLPRTEPQTPCPVENTTVTENTHPTPFTSMQGVPQDYNISQSFASQDMQIQGHPASDQIIDMNTQQQVDISAVMNQRLLAMHRLQNNQNDVEAIMQIKRAEQEMQTWVQSKYQLGQFTGSTGARILTPAELAAGTHQAWPRKDQLQVAAPVQSGMGMALLQKMGWRPGEGLGKDKKGTLEPLTLEVKMDKKGLVAPEERSHATPSQRAGANRNIGKHPVSLLNELCSRRRYGPPIFECCLETGPDHKKSFVFKVTVNGVEYKPSVASLNKKQAKVEAASICLTALGVTH